MKKLVEKFGSSGKVQNLPNNIRLIDSGEINDATVVMLTPDAGSFYLLVTIEYNASTGAYRGHHLVTIVAPESDAYGTTAAAHVNAAASSNSGVSISYPSDSTITLARSSATYAVRWALYKLL